MNCNQSKVMIRIASDDAAKVTFFTEWGGGTAPLPCLSVKFKTSLFLIIIIILITYEPYDPVGHGSIFSI